MSAYFTNKITHPIIIMWFFVCVLIKVAVIMYSNRKQYNHMQDNKKPLLLTHHNIPNKVEINYDMSIHRYLYLEDV